MPNGMGNRLREPIGIYALSFSDIYAHNKKRFLIPTTLYV